MHGPRVTVVSICVIFLFVTLAFSLSTTDGRSSPKDKATGNPTVLPERVEVAQKTNAPPPARTPAASILAWYTFDSDQGCDPQGWTSVDLTADGLFFHVDDFVGLGGGDKGMLNPLDGSKSLWCGARPTDTHRDIEYYQTLPGYGNRWRQEFRSNGPFTVSGDVTVQFDVSYDTEAGYDQLTLEFSDETHTPGTEPNWQTLLTLSGTNTESNSITIPAASLPLGLVNIRFFFDSDSFGSDQDGSPNTDGAAIIDNLIVSDGSGVVSSQDFEAESVGATQTVDGDWYAYEHGYGDYASLHDGTTVVQKASPNASCLWGFFGGTENYECGGYPEQLVVPYADALGYRIYNQIRSPIMTVDEDESEMYLEYDVYLDLTNDAAVFYGWYARFNDGSGWSTWRSDNYRYYGTADWTVKQIDLHSYCPFPITLNTQVQVAFAVQDYCNSYPWSSCECHSNGPLFDNIRLYLGGTVAVAIQGFEARELYDGIELNWAISADEPISGYRILRRSDGSSVDVDINPQELLPATQMRYLDSEPEPGKSYAYTLVVVSEAGEEKRSRTIRIDKSADALALEQNEPNPFNPATTIKFTIDRADRVSLNVYDVSGKLVRKLVEKNMTSGHHSEEWDGLDDNGNPVSSGLYFYRLVAGKRSLCRKAILLK